MNYNKATNYYKKVEKSHNEVKNPIEVVKTMVKELNKSMTVVVNCIEKNEKTTTKSKYFSKALIIIYTLQTTLDFDKGGKLATQLFQIYEFCRQQLISGFSKNIKENINKSINALNQVFFEDINGKPAKI